MMTQHVNLQIIEAICGLVWYDGIRTEWRLGGTLSGSGGFSPTPGSGYGKVILQPGTVFPVPVAAASVPDGLQWKWDSSLAWKGRFYGG